MIDDGPFPAAHKTNGICREMNGTTANGLFVAHLHLPTLKCSHSWVFIVEKVLLRPRQWASDFCRLEKVK